MRINPNERLKSSLTRIYYLEGVKVLIAIQQPVIDMVDNMDLDSLKQRSRLLMKPELVSGYLTHLWMKTGSIFAIDTIKRIKSQKSVEEYDFWEDYFRRYTRERSALIANEIIDSQAKVVNQIIDDLIEQGFEQGLGIPEIQRAMRKDLVDALTQINKYQAERIARTEVIGASNKGSFDGAKNTGYEMTKEWMTSGLPGIRDSHLFYESQGEVKMDYEYAPGLKHPGDPGCSDASDIINCRCTEAYNIL